LTNVLIGRTGYTGEDGFEIYVPSDEATSDGLEAVLDAGRNGSDRLWAGARQHCGLEAKMSLYGHEISGHHQRLGSGTRPLL